MLTPIYSKHKIFVHVQSPISSVPQSHGMCDRDQLMVYLIISLITGNLEALQSTKICTECCRYKSEQLDNTGATILHQN